MFKTSKDLKEFILWCKSNKVQSFKNNDIAFELSGIAFAEQLINTSDASEITSFTDKTLADTDPEQEQEDNDLLYWSSN